MKCPKCKRVLKCAACGHRTGDTFEELGREGGRRGGAVPGKCKSRGDRRYYQDLADKANAKRAEKRAKKELGI